MSTADPRILDLVIADLHTRDAKGRETYGASLRASSPNEALRDAYEEALDQAMYLCQEIERRRKREEEARALRAVVAALPACTACDSAPATNVDEKLHYYGCDEHCSPDSVDLPWAPALRVLAAAEAA